MNDYQRVILDLIRQLNGSKKLKQVTDILQGVKTSQNMVDLFLYRIQPFFGVFENKAFFDLKMTCDNLITDGYIILKSEDRLALSSLGLSTVSNFTLQAKYQNVNGWRWHRRLPVFALSLQLATQMTANRYHKIAHYFPIVRDTTIQALCKRWWLGLEKDDEQVLAKNYHDELTSLLDSLTVSPEIVVDRLTGGQTIGLTAEQSANKHHLEKNTYDMQWLEALSQMMFLLERYPKSWPLLSQLLLDRPVAQLTESAQITYQLLLDGTSVADIQQQRRLKKSTIVDHYVQLIGLEIMPLDAFVNKANREYYEANKKMATSLKEARMNMPELSYDTLKLCLVSGR